MIFIHYKFTTLLYLWTSIILLFSIYSVIVNKTRIKEIVIYNFNKIKEIFPSYIIVILLIGIQVFVPFKYMYINDDDARFVGIATTAIETNTLMEYDALTGSKYESNPPLRRALASFTLYPAVVSKLTFFPPAILSHTILPVILILLGYAIYSQIGYKILKLKREDNFIFLVLLSIINIFGNYSTRTNFTYFLIRIWQGKAILAGIAIPAIWLLFFEAKENDDLKNWGVILLIILFACMVSTIGIFLAPMSLIIISFLFSVKEKKINYLIKSLVCSLPCVMYAIIYFVFK